jgi:hypothetical protein
MTPLFLIILSIAATTLYTQDQNLVKVPDSVPIRAVYKPQFSSFICQRKYTYSNINGLSYNLYIGDDGLIELIYFSNDKVNVKMSSGIEILH